MFPLLPRQNGWHISMKKRKHSFKLVGPNPFISVHSNSYTEMTTNKWSFISVDGKFKHSLVVYDRCGICMTCFEIYQGNLKYLGWVCTKSWQTAMVKLVPLQNPKLDDITVPPESCISFEMLPQNCHKEPVRERTPRLSLISPSSQR